ncbi:AAA family ATPase [Methylobacterium aquaticum]|uniref:nucleotide-binding protein n=1 Tax=Methylobacterium aquaticum TaxID=270351 RepID=UPI003D17066D
MRIITFATQKGGSGKSTILASIAVAAEAAGLRVAILDTDPQRTIVKWSNRRKVEGHATPFVRACEPHQLAAEIRKLPLQGIDLCLIDTAGAHNVSVAPAIEQADFCLVPVKPTIADAQAATETAKALRERRKKFAFVLSQCFGSTARVNEAAAGLLRHGEIAAANIYHRVDYPDADSAGLGVTEYNPNGPAAKELRLLWAWLFRAIGGESVKEESAA